MRKKSPLVSAENDFRDIDWSWLSLPRNWLTLTQIDQNIQEKAGKIDQISTKIGPEKKDFAQKLWRNNTSVGAANVNIHWDPAHPLERSLRKRLRSLKKPRGPKDQKKFEILIENEIFERATHRGPIFGAGNRDIEIKSFERDQKFRSRLKISIEIKFVSSLGPLGKIALISEITLP